jgi:hypothetical protein
MNQSTTSRYRERRLRIDRTPAPDTTPSQQAELKGMFASEGWRMFLGIVQDLAKGAKQVILSPQSDNDARLDAVLCAQVLSTLMQATYDKADAPLPEKLMEALS